MRLPTPVFFLTAFLVLALDQGTKVWVRDNLPPGESLPGVWLFQLTHVFNTGAAFGILPNQTTILTIVALVVSGVIIIYGRALSKRSVLLAIALGLQLGGAVGNLIDRVALGHVTDFVDLRNPAGENIWPVFNVADASIVIGVLLLAFYVIFLDRRDTSKAETEAVASDAGDGAPAMEPAASMVARFGPPLTAPAPRPATTSDDGSADRPDPQPAP